MNRGAETQERIEMPEHLTRERVEGVAREFTRVYRDLKEQTFKSTTWLGVPVVKSPNEIVVAQEIIAETRPQLIIETGTHRGGGALLFASVQELLGIDGRVIAIDIDLSRVADRVREHPRVELVDGSSTDPDIVSRINSVARGQRVMVDLDSDHAADHVLDELRAYSALVSPGCYLIVEDTFVGGRPVLPDMEPGPTEALDAWLAERPPFEIDRWPERFLLTQNPRGYLRRIDPQRQMPRRPAGYLIGSLELGVTEKEAVLGAEAERKRHRRAVEGLERELEALHRQTEVLEREMEPLRRQDEAFRRELKSLGKLAEERRQLLARERSRMRRIINSRAYRTYKRVRSLPGIRHYLDRKARDSRPIVETD